MKLKEGDLIQVQGYVMLKNIDEGIYKILRVRKLYNHDVYDFARPRGKKVIWCHYAENVDPWVQDKNHQNLNKIVKLEQS